MSKKQVRQNQINALKNAHTEIHRVLGLLNADRTSGIMAKQSISRVVKTLVEVLAQLE